MDMCTCSGEDNNVAVLLPLAREYQIDDLTQRCEQFLLCREPSVRSLVLAEEFSLETLEKQCLDYVNRLPLLTVLCYCITDFHTYLPISFFPSIPSAIFHCHISFIYYTEYINRI